MREWLKKYWDILGGTICGVGISLISNWNVKPIQLCYWVVILCLVCIGLLRCWKDAQGKRREKKILIDKLVDNTKPIEATNLSINSDKQTREVYTAIVEAKNGGKKFMSGLKKLWKSALSGLKWVWTYRQQVFGLLVSFAIACVSVYGYIISWIDKSVIEYGSRFEFLNVISSWIWDYSSNPARCILSNIIVIAIAVIAVFYLVRNQVKWVGVGSLSTAQDYLKNLATEAVSETDDEKVVKKISSIIKQFKPQLKKAKKSLDEAQETYDNAVSELSSAEQTNKLLGSVIEDTSALAKAKETASSALNTAKATYDKINNIVNIAEQKLAALDK